jgi:hypothetical protein
MLSISNNGIITISRGDSFSIPLFINQGTELEPVRYELKTGEAIYFGIVFPDGECLVDASQRKFFVQDGVTYLGIPEPNLTFDNALVRKTFDSTNKNDDGDVVMSFTSQDTAFLLPGTYYYQVRAKILKDNVEYVNTIIKKTAFNVIE